MTFRQPDRGQRFYKWWLVGERPAPRTPPDIAPLGMHADGTYYVILDDVIERLTEPPLGVIVGRYWWEDNILMLEVEEKYKPLLEECGM